MSQAKSGRGTRDSSGDNIGGSDGKKENEIFAENIDDSDHVSRNSSEEDVHSRASGGGMKGSGGGDGASSGKKRKEICSVEEIQSGNNGGDGVPARKKGKEKLEDDIDADEDEFSEGEVKIRLMSDLMRSSSISPESRRKKSASSGENTESVFAGQGSGDGKNASYHCNYCNKDVTGRVRIKCAVCSDFDLCVECFSVGAEVHPHKSDHPYRVMENLSFPLLCPEWNADEEMLLVEGLGMYGMGNWAEVAEHIATKSKEACIDHYTDAYLNSPCFPLPDMTHIVGKNRNELLAMAKGHREDKKGEILLEEESPFFPSSMKIGDPFRSGSASRIPSAVAGGKVNNKASDTAHVKDQGDHLKMEDHTSARSFGSHKQKSVKIGEPSWMESIGYNPKRHEFDIEYDNDAEELLADMEFNEKDTEVERELKLRVLRIYSKRLDERQKRKDFIIERNLLYESEFVKGLSQEEKELVRQFDPYMRFHSREAHQELLENEIDMHRKQKRLQELEEARAAGCRTIAQIDRYHEQKRRIAAEGGAFRMEGSQAGTSRQGSPSVPVSSDSFRTLPNNTLGGQPHSSLPADFESLLISAESLLSEYEKRLCREIGLAPPEYLKLQMELAKQILNGRITKKSDAHSLFRVEPHKLDRVYDVLVKKGIAKP